MLGKWVRIKIEKYFSAFHSEQGGAAGACWAHDPEVGGSKPFSARLACFSQVRRFFPASYTYWNIHKAEMVVKRKPPETISQPFSSSHLPGAGVSHFLCSSYLQRPQNDGKCYPILLVFHLSCLLPHCLLGSHLEVLKKYMLNQRSLTVTMAPHISSTAGRCGLWMGWSQDKLWKESIRERPGMMGNLHVLGGGRGGLMWFHLVLEEGTWRRKCPVGKC